jgi:hypothetical protein
MRTDEDLPKRERCPHTVTNPVSKPVVRRLVLQVVAGVGDEDVLQRIRIADHNTRENEKPKGQSSG